MANTRARRRRRRRTNWQAAFWMLIIGIVIGFVLGIWLCAEYDLLDVVGQDQICFDLRGEPQVTATEPPVTAQEEEEEQVPTPKPLITPKVVEPTPAPVEPTSEPVVTPEATLAAEPTPEPVITAAPAEELAPAEEPAPTAQPQEDNGFGIASGFDGGDEEADEEAEPVMTDENGNVVTKEQYEAVQGTEAQPEEEAVQTVTEEAVETVTEETPAAEPEEQPVQTEAVQPEQAAASGAAVRTEPRPRTNPVQPQEWFTFETEVDSEGMPYYGKDSAGTVVALAMRVTDYMSPDDYAAEYAGQYQLYGVEAAVAIEIRNDSATTAIVPDNALGIVLRDKADMLNDSYPLADAPMKASTDITIAPGETVTVYKRYALDKADGPYPFLSVAYMVGGETCRTYFLLDGME